jgi:hypothetical protein
VKLYPETSEYFHVSLTQPKCNSGILYIVHVWEPINSIRKHGITSLPNSIFPHSHITCDSQHLPILRKIIFCQRCDWTRRSGVWEKCGEIKTWTNDPMYCRQRISTQQSHWSVSINIFLCHCSQPTSTVRLAHIPPALSPPTALYELCLLIILVLAAFLNYGGVFQIASKILHRIARN